MECVSYQFNADKLVIYPIGDMHIGSKGSYYQQALKQLDDNQEAKIILMGDLVDNAILNSVGDVYSEIENPQSQLRIVRDILEKYRDRILGIVGGNHERRSIKTVGIDIMQLFAETYSIPYSDSILTIDISLSIEGKQLVGKRNRINYVINCVHGFAGGKGAAKSVRQGEQFSDMYINGDIFITGHTHIPSNTKLSRYEYDTHNKVIRTVNYHVVNIPAWVREIYAEQKGLKPTADAKVKITLFACKPKKIEVSIE